MTKAASSAEQTSERLIVTSNPTLAAKSADRAGDLPSKRPLRPSKTSRRAAVEDAAEWLCFESQRATSKPREPRPPVTRQAPGQTAFGAWQRDAASEAHGSSLRLRNAQFVQLWMS